MTAIRIYSLFTKTGSIVFNVVLVIIISLLAGPFFIMMVLENGLSEACSAMGWAIVFAGASVTVIAALVLSERQRLLILAAYCAAAFFLVAAGWDWWQHNVTSSKLSPPPEALILGCHALVSLGALASNRPLPRAPLLGRGLSTYNR